MTIGTKAVSTARATTGSRPEIRPYRNESRSGVHSLHKAKHRQTCTHRDHDYDINSSRKARHNYHGHRAVRASLTGDDIDAKKKKKHQKP